MDAMLSEMSSEDFARWQAFYDLEPWGCAAAELRAGVVAAAVWNSAGKVLKEGTGPMSPAKFFPSRVVSRGDEPRDDARSIESKLRALAGRAAGERE